MTTLDRATTELSRSRKEARGFTFGTIAALGSAALVAAGLWFAANQPVAVPDYHGRIGGLAFAPYHRGQTPERNEFPTAAQIDGDMAIAKGLTDRIRTYTVQDKMAEIPAIAQKHGLKVTLGGWISGEPRKDAAEISRLIATANANPDVDRIMVGNEAILRADVSVPALIADIARVKAATHVPVSTAEPWHVWLKHPELAASVDYITIHLLPYWEGLPIDQSLTYIMDKLAQVQRANPGKKIVIGEVGWPSSGVTKGGAQASRTNQALFLRQFFAIAQAKGLDYFVMEAFDQPWKTSFEGRAAGYWGMMDLDRAPKWGMTGPVVETPNWRLWAAGAIAAALLAAGALLSRRPDIRFTGKLMVAGLAQGFTSVFALVLLAMSEKYLSAGAALVWGMLAVGQALLLLLLLADSFDLAEVVWGRSMRRRPAIAPAPAADLARMPKVSVHIAICNEPPEMVRQTLNALARLDYKNYEVLVIDNNTTDPALWEPVADHCARLGPKFRFFHLGKWPGYKAGALNFGMRETAEDAQIVAVIDSDYLVASDWLRCMVPHFSDPKVGFVQSPQDYFDNDGSFFKRLMFWEYAGFFHIGMVQRNERNAVIQHGTMTLVRKSALIEAGNWSEWTICEDSELGLRLFRRGWEAVYSPHSFGRGVMPDDFAAFRKQRFRWAYGAMQIMRGHAGALFNPFNRELSLGQRWHFVMGWLPWIGDALGLAFVLMGLVWSAGLIVAPQRYEFPIVLFMVPSLGLFLFKLMQIMVLYAVRVPCGFADRLGAALGGLALSHAIGKAVWKGLFIRSAPFLRTPKMENAPALVQGLVMAREELVLLLLTWTAMIGVGWAHHLATPEAKLWCAVLFTQSLPYLASVSVAVIAAFPAAKPAAAAAGATAPAHSALMEFGAD